MDSCNRRGLLLCALIVACLFGPRDTTQAYARTNPRDCARTRSTPAEASSPKALACENLDRAHFSLAGDPLVQETQPNGTPCISPTIAVGGGAGKVELRYGESEIVEGRLGCAGPPPYEAQIEVASFTEAGEATGAPTFVDVAADGSFHWMLPSGPNRELVFSYASAFGERPAALTTLEVNVTPRIELA
jgi:hypothetical protein